MEVISSIRLQLENSQSSVRWTPSPEPCFVNGDPVYLTNLFYNLADNAIKYKGTGLELQISCHIKAGRITISFKDNGPGIGKPISHYLACRHMSHKVLYVEDEPFLARIVSDGLQGSGYTVTVVADGEEAFRQYQAMQPDICLLDIMLPNKDGYEIAKALRADNPRLPIIFLSAKTLTGDVVKGFKSGGNDYLKKPFSMEELVVRMEALVERLAREEPGRQIRYHFGNCRLDTLHQTLTTSAGEYALSYKEMALLEMMVLHRNTVLERTAVLQKIWGEDNYYNTRSMDVFMTHLRKLLKNEPGLRIINLRSVGYKFIC